ncbi:hypothetical protein SteCoe_37873 [Stentor coeruleus]|uniref:Uncharacterized protein n=1 Tax=Stentor coeruleus TaxID=5963 RepID=A0A1R2AM71_9CILI|nr:hypothetical protein SteCoe_37873 [Stentor coeruleus]
MLRKDIKSFIFSYLTLQEILKNLAPVSKDYNLSSKNSLKFLTSAISYSNHLACLSYSCPNLESLKIILKDESEALTILDKIRDFVKLKTLKIDFDEKLCVKFPINLENHIQQLAKLDELIISGYKFFGIEYFSISLDKNDLKLLPKIISKIIEKSIENYSENFVVDLIEAMPLKKYFKSKNTIKASINFIWFNFDEFYKSIHKDRENLGSILRLSTGFHYNYFTNLKKLTIIQSSTIGFEYFSSHGDLIFLEKLHVEFKRHSIFGPDIDKMKPQSILNGFNNLFNKAKLLKKIHINFIYSTVFDYFKIANDLLFAIKSHESIKYINGLPIQNFFSKTFASALIKKDMKTKPNSFENELFRIFSYEIAQVQCIEIKYEHYKKIYTKHELGNVMNLENHNKDSLLSYFYNIRDQNCKDKFELINTFNDISKEDRYIINIGGYLDELKDFKKIFRGKKSQKCVEVCEFGGTNSLCDKNICTSITILELNQCIAIGFDNGLLLKYYYPSRNFIGKLMLPSRITDLVVNSVNIMACCLKVGVFIIDQKSFIVLRECQLPEIILSSISISNDNILIISDDHKIVLVKEQNQVLYHKKKVLSVDCNDKIVVSGCEDMCVYIWDKENCIDKYVLEGHKGFCYFVKLAGEKIFSLGYDKMMIEWDVKSRCCVRKITLKYRFYNCLDVYENLILLSYRGVIKLIDIENNIISKIKDNDKTTKAIFISPNNIVCVIKQKITVLDFAMNIQWNTALPVENS